MAEEGVGINGFGRVGQMFLRMALERELRVVVINDPDVGVDLMASMLQRDSTQGAGFNSSKKMFSLSRSLERRSDSERQSVVLKREAHNSLPKDGYLKHPLVKVWRQVHRRHHSSWRRTRIKSSLERRSLQGASCSSCA